MIVQDFPDKYVMIAQHDHAAISGIMAEMWEERLFHGFDKRSSVEYAAMNHDIGWKLIDEAPFWNDKTSSPFTFTDFPTPPKTMLYRYGIEEVARTDYYAALLCSWHYSRFLQNNPSDAAQKFVHGEKARRENIIQALGDFDEDAYSFHYGILQMVDDLSLFICLNEPGVQQPDFHPFFKNGIKRNEGVTTLPEEKIHPYWKNKQTIYLDPFPFKDTFEVSLKQRTISKKAIEENGLIISYQDALTENFNVTIASK